MVTDARFPRSSRPDSRGLRAGDKHDDMEILAGTARLAGDLEVPREARGVVLFAHGSGSGRFSPRNRAVGATWQRSICPQFARRRSSSWAEETNPSSG